MSAVEFFETHALTAYEIAPDGSSVLLKMVDCDGTQMGIVLSTDHLRHLALTMPKLVEQVLRARTGDKAHRLVHQVHAWKVERGEAGQVILSFETADGFELTVAVPDRDLTSMAECVVDYELEAFPQGLQFH
jgi:hypothetical protein